MFHRKNKASVIITAIEIDRILAMYYSGYKSHISLSFYPTEETYKKFEKELWNYTYSKSAIQFALKNPLPKELIRDIVEHGVQVKIKFMKKRKNKK